MKITHMYDRASDQHVYSCDATGKEVRVSTLTLTGFKRTEQLVAYLTDRGLFDMKKDYMKHPECDSQYDRERSGVWYRNPRNNKTIFVALEKLAELDQTGLDQLLIDAGLFRIIEVVTP